MTLYGSKKIGRNGGYPVDIPHVSLGSQLELESADTADIHDNLCLMGTRPSTMKFCSLFGTQSIRRLCKLTKFMKIITIFLDSFV